MQRTVGVILFLVLVVSQVAAASELRIATIEPRNQQGEFKTALLPSDLNSIHVWVQNLPSAETCSSAVITMDINKAETGQGIIETTTSSPREIGSGGRTKFDFNKSDTTGPGLFRLTSTAEGVYRITATAKCGGAYQHERSLVFSFNSEQKTSIPETPFWLGALAGIAMALLLWRGPQKKLRTEG